MIQPEVEYLENSNHKLLFTIDNTNNIVVIEEGYDLKDIIGRNIARYRKDKGLTQEGLAQILGVTFQAVSKWEGD